MAKMNSRIDFIENKIHIIEDKLKMMLDMFSLMKQNIDTLHSTIHHTSKTNSSFVKHVYHKDHKDHKDHKKYDLTSSDSESDNEKTELVPPSIQIIKSKDYPNARSRCAI
jgi:NAD-dependent SIR2 family protein deacetylase